jgi:hypothetical protein
LTCEIAIVKDSICQPCVRTPVSDLSGLYTDGEARSQGNDQYFQDIDCFVEELHMLTSFPVLAP